MVSLKERTIKDFIELENLYNNLIEETNEENTLLFFNLLLQELPKNEDGYLDSLKECQIQMQEIKETFVWIYNPPKILPSSITETIKNTDLAKEFQEDYNGYIELAYLLIQSFNYKIEEVFGLSTFDFLFWSEYLTRKRILELLK